MATHFLMSLAYTLSLLSFIKEVLHSIPFMVAFLFLWPLPSRSASLLISPLLNCMAFPVSNTPCWYLSSGKLEWVLFLALPSVPYWCIFSCWNILLSPSIPVSDCLTSCNKIPFTSSVNFSSLPLYSAFNVTGKWVIVSTFWLFWLYFVTKPL